MGYMVFEIAIDVFFKNIHNNFIKPVILKKIHIHVKDRALKSTFTLEAMHDIKSVPSPEVERAIIKAFEEEMKRKADNNDRYST